MRVPGTRVGERSREQVYDEITERVLAAMERGVAPWRRPWTVADPFNALTLRPYRGINLLLLKEAGYDEPRWLTLRQLEKLGGSVGEGERPTTTFGWWPAALPSRNGESD